LPESEWLFLEEDVTDGEVVRRLAREAGPAALVGTVEGRVAAWGVLRRPARGWMRHVGEVRAVVAPEHQRKGVAQALLRELVGQAVLQGVEKMIAMVAQGQPGALLAFEHLGFSREAVLHGHVRDVQGRTRDLHVLASHTRDLFDRMDLMIDNDRSGDE